jgi:hypothetical protein
VIAIGEGAWSTLKKSWGTSNGWPWVPLLEVSSRLLPFAAPLSTLQIGASSYRQAATGFCDASPVGVELSAMTDEPPPDATPDLEPDANRNPASAARMQPEEGVAHNSKASIRSDAETEANASAEQTPKARGQSADTTQTTPTAAKSSQTGNAAKPRKGTQPGGAVKIEEPLPPGALARVIHVLIRQTPSWLVSMVVHVVVLLVLALVSLPPPTLEEARRLVITPDKDQPLEEIEELDQEPLEEIDFDVSDVVFDAPPEPETIDPSPFDDITSARVSVEFSDIGLELAPTSDLASQVGTVMGNDLDGRGSGKEQLVKGGGGNEASEQAVAMALKWLAEHQFADGSWSFDHTTCPRCRGQCRNPGDIPEARNGATGMALLPFLGAGQTHRTGKYKDQVRAGLYYLVKHMKVSPKGGSLNESGGNMYSHGICAIALCEAYAMTHDKDLYAPAQLALNFIAYAQDPVGGGWRYKPRDRGDTSVVGWQIMALKSGHMAYLRVPPIN